ncbi:MAG TPA: glycosyl hydrolase 53 family protein [Chitinophagaceae bacterium]|nr:glycosyl hydrolase 53 family protein [Chitinophagaceae bacterium]
MNLSKKSKIQIWLIRVLELAAAGCFFFGPAFGQAQNFTPVHKLRGKILGADISFLPQIEASGKKFYDHGKPMDAILLLKQYGFNYIRLRIFVNPQDSGGYSKQGYCDLQQTEQMASRIRAAHMKFLLDFHYSDYWADPGKQFKPASWAKLDFPALTAQIKTYTEQVLDSLKALGDLPDMVQIGNEINHGILWPDGRVEHLDSLATLLKAGIEGARKADPSVIIMLHIADGGENAESRYFLDNMMKRGVRFDVIGESYYPRWHGPLDSLRANLNDLAGRYKQRIVVVEYSQFKKQVNDIVFSLPHDKGAGTFIWEPLDYGEALFDRKGNVLDSAMNIYPEVVKTYHIH